MERTNNLLFDVGDRPKFGNLLLYATQLLLAILAATIMVPKIIGLPSQTSSAILGAGIGTIVYILFTKGKSPIVISSSFAYLAAFPTALAFGYCGILVGGILSGLVYVIIAIIVKFAGSRWVNKIMPPVIIGPVVALIGLSLASSAMTNLVSTNVNSNFSVYNLVSIFCGLVAFFVVVICSTQNRFSKLKLLPFIIGIGAGYLVASIFTGIGIATNVDYLKIIDWSPITDLNFSEITAYLDYPKFSLIKSIQEMIEGKVVDAELLEATEDAAKYLFDNPAGIASIAIAFCPIALVSFAEHLADHKNVSSILGRDLIGDEPGLHRTLLGDGVGSIAGTVCGVCPNTSYGEGIACVAITKNASVATTLTTAIFCIVLAFITPFNKVLETIPSCVMGGICLALYGYISVSGLKMFKNVDLDNNVNLFTVCSILIAGIGGLIIAIPIRIEGGQIADTVQITSIATALLIGIATYQIGRHLASRHLSKVSEVNAEVARTDPLRYYLKKFNPEILAKGIMVFGFIHENVDFTVGQLSNFMRSDEMLNNRSLNDLVLLITLFGFQGYEKGMKKKEVIQIIKDNCVRIDKESVVNA